MDANSLFLIYGRVNDKLILMARDLTSDEVTKKAKALAKRSERGEILILEDQGKRAEGTRQQSSVTKARAALGAMIKK